MELLCKRKVKRVFPQTVEEFEDLIVVEHELVMTLNGKIFGTFYCSPCDLVELIVGSLYTNQIISDMSDILNINFELDNTQVYVTTRPRVIPLQMAIRSHECKFSAQSIISLSTEFATASLAFQNTGGIHSVAVCDTEKILCFFEDIGRHNAMDKMIGYAIRNSLHVQNLYILTSGRIPLEIVKKVSNTNFPMLVSRSAPTDRGIEQAINSHLQLVGFSRQGRFNIYHDENLIDLRS